MCLFLFLLDQKQYLKYIIGIEKIDKKSYHNIINITFIIIIVAIMIGIKNKIQNYT